MIEIAKVPTPIGSLDLGIAEGRLCAVAFDYGAEGIAQVLARRFGEIEASECRDDGRIARRICDYFAGDLSALEEIEVDIEGTPFQKSVWSAIREIPARTTKSYAEIAREVEKSLAVRAVGTATGSNPVCLVIPCHRVVRSNGELGGYGAGLERKRWLLRHEGNTFVSKSTELVRDPASLR